MKLEDYLTPKESAIIMSLSLAVFSVILLYVTLENKDWIWARIKALFIASKYRKNTLGYWIDQFEEPYRTKAFEVGKNHKYPEAFLDLYAPSKSYAAGTVETFCQETDKKIWIDYCDKITNEERNKGL